jgi:serine phosphatase RsbU (regulator of sigma subunit)
MSRIVLLIEHVENRRLLAEWLSLQHEVSAPESPAVAALDVEFDLGIVDAPSLERYGRWIDALRNAVHPLFLPFLLVLHRHGAGPTGHVWEHVDELIVTPVEKLELRARVQTLLRARTLSLANASLASRLETELARAREVQASLLPREAPVLSGFDLAARCIPAREIGGDFFDWQPSEAAAVLSVGDVMGKGIPAALLASTVRSVLRALARKNAPGAALDLLREALSQDLERASSFVTLFHARVLGDEVQYVDAGHGHALVRRAASGRLERLERGGRPVGFPAAAAYRESTLRLAEGDFLVVFSDGLFEGGNRRVEELIDEVDADTSAAAIVDDLVDLAPKEESDDVTVLVLKRTGPTIRAA